MAAIAGALGGVQILTMRGPKVTDVAIPIERRLVRRLGFGIGVPQSQSAWPRCF